MNLIFSLALISLIIAAAIFFGVWAGVSAIRKYIGYNPKPRRTL